jgi:gamma-glutamyltranspeptidase / glutathione hydrolase
VNVASRAGCVLAAVALSVAGCGGSHRAAPKPAGPCDIVPNGTPVTKTPPPGSAPSSRNTATNPEMATGYRGGMTVVRAAH